MAKKVKNDYFSMFIRQASISCEAAEEILRFLKVFDPFQLHETLDAVHKLEQEADDLNLEILRLLAKEFLPPIEREDIVLLTHEMDNITDAIEDTLRHLYMYNVTKIRPQALEFCELLVQQIKVLENAMEEFQNFAKSKTLQDLIHQVADFEEQADVLYTESMRELFSNTVDPKELLIWSSIYGSFETCSDTCEHAADVVENAVMKNM